MSRQEKTELMTREVATIFSHHSLINRIHLPMLDSRGDVVATANSLRQLGYTVTISSMDPFGYRLTVKK